MIKFFRRIRQQLLSQNKFSKYMLYAIGEILLVVIGIVIALQLNTWNEGRKNRILEKYYVNRIIADINSDLDEIKQMEVFAQKRIAVSQHILVSLGEDYLTKLKEIKRMYDGNRITFIEASVQKYPNLESFNFSSFGESLGYVTAGGREVDIFDYTYQELLTSGKFDIISDHFIREKISAYWNHYQDLLSIQDTYKDAASKYISVLNDHSIPYMNKLSADEVIKLLGDQTQYKTALKNLLWSYAHGLGYFPTIVKDNAELLKAEMETYLNLLD